MVGNLRAWLVLAAALAIGACTQAPLPATNTAPDTNALVPIDQTDSARSDRWTVVQPSPADRPMAVIASPDRAAFINVGCRGSDATSATIALVSAAGATASPDSAHLELAFDGAAPASSSWQPTRFEADRAGFEIDARAPDFLASFAGLRLHGNVDAIAREQGKEVFRRSFTLQGAGAAIDEVLKYCPLSSRHVPDASAVHWGVVKRTTTGNRLMVGILRPGSDHGIEILCDENAKTVGIMIWPKQPFAVPAENLRLTLAFDDGPPLRQYWNASDVVFDVWNADPGFANVIGRLSGHRQVTVTMGPSGQEQSEVFSLDGADAAIGSVLAACGR